MIEVLKQLVDALEKANRQCSYHNIAPHYAYDEAIQAGKKAIAKLESQEPWCMKMNGCKTKCDDCPDKRPPTPQRTEQEYESVLIDGVAYTIPSKVAVEILGLHLDLLQLKQEQEPVVWVSEDVCKGQYIDGRPRKIWWECEKGVGTAFYTNPPQRTWVKLTDEDISEIVRGTHNTGSFVRAIEAKFKEKNT